MIVENIGRATLANLGSIFLILGFLIPGHSTYVGFPSPTVYGDLPLPSLLILGTFLHGLLRFRSDIFSLRTHYDPSRTVCDDS